MTLCSKKFTLTERVRYVMFLTARYVYIFPCFNGHLVKLPMAVQFQFLLRETEAKRSGSKRCVL